MTNALPVMLYLVALVELVLGLAAFAISVGAIQEILGVLAFGFGFLTIALGAILEELRGQRADGGRVRVTE